MPENQERVLSKFLKKHRDDFAKFHAELGKTNVYEHEIDTYPDALLVRMPFYRATPVVCLFAMFLFYLPFIITFKLDRRTELIGFIKRKELKS